MTNEQAKQEAIAAFKSGRAFNGAHRDAGTIVHLVPPLPPTTSGDWFDKALCGARPGWHGNGWHKSINPVNCYKCIKKQESQ
ncbi:hypothetical protein HDC90_001127 [Pedobacter sp. AK013]|uniref:hypothetical protein n=1 Tax=Pedobacter sp. AK013 TaxID=2723071 RepID=UPI00161A452B|nr:hypothetical protein [Pedobacter sp. AK013]MBB6236515.1 hypothetical protein [Pedobacter sp. AK013]